jgi:hypothetical protein
LANDTHIFNLTNVVPFAFDHFLSQLTFMGLAIQLGKCLAWAPFGLLLGFTFLVDFGCPIN